MRLYAEILSCAVRGVKDGQAFVVETTFTQLAGEAQSLHTGA